MTHRISRAGTLIPALLAFTLMVGGTAQAVSGPYRRIAIKQIQGDAAVTFVSTTTNRPNAIYVQVTATPRQSVLVTWNMTCSRGFGAAGKRGQFNTSSTLKHKVPMPFAHPDSCIVSLGGQLSASGHLTVRIYKR